MLVQLNLTFDLDTTAGRVLFAALQNVLVPASERVTLAYPQDAPASSNPPDALAPSPPSPGRQQAAANARAAKAAKLQEAKTPPTAPAEPSEDQLGPVTLGNGDGDQVDDLGLIDPSMSPGEARDAGLALVREAYAAGKVVEVKKLQKAWGIAKFYDIPVERGHEFYQQVMQLAVETGIRK